MNTTRPRPTPTEHPALTALAGVVWACDWNAGMPDPGDRCGAPAVWAARGHGGRSSECPAVVLLCDEHLPGMRDRLMAELERAVRRGRSVYCMGCGRTSTALGDVLWGVERIRP